MNELPHVYKNKINSSNNKKFYYGSINTDKYINIEKDSSTILDIVESLFSNIKNGYTKEVKIVLKDRSINTRLVKQYKNYMLTIDNDKIYYEDILNIEVL